jgi:EAL domain-containing protein (putative c-di-GMP-specific phosphodiesterase class I)
VIKSVIDVTTALGLGSVAEGVEQQAQLVALEELGCDNIQGKHLNQLSHSGRSGA